MRIDSKIGEVGKPEVKPAGDKVAGKTEAGATAPATSVQVSREASAAASAAHQSRAERHHHVQHLKAIVAEGQYQVDKAALAEKIADDELARAGRQ